MFTSTKEITLFLRGTISVTFVLLSVMQSGSTRVILSPFGIYEDSDTTSISTLASSSTTHLVLSHSDSVDENGWSIFRGYVMPVILFVTCCILSSFYLFRAIRIFRIHFKYHRFTFSRRNPVDTADIRRRNTIVEMDPLGSLVRSTAHLSAVCTPSSSESPV